MLAQSLIRVKQIKPHVLNIEGLANEDEKTFVQIDLFKKSIGTPTRPKFKVTIIQQQKLSVCCNFWDLKWNPAFSKFLGPEIAEILQSISSPRIC